MQKRLNLLTYRYGRVNSLLLQKSIFFFFLNIIVSFARAPHHPWSRQIFRFPERSGRRSPCCWRTPSFETSDRTVRLDVRQESFLTNAHKLQENAWRLQLSNRRVNWSLPRSRQVALGSPTVDVHEKSAGLSDDHGSSRDVPAVDPDLKEGLHRPRGHQTHVSGSCPGPTQPVGTHQTQMG